MKLLIKLLVSFVWGFVSHQSAPAIALLRPGLSNLTSYGIGILCSLPVGVAVNREFGDIKNNDTRFAAAYLSTFFSYGAGVAIGYLISTLMDTLHPITRNQDRHP